MRGDNRLHRLFRRPAAGLQRWGTDVRGATAIEFAIIAVPFFLFIFGIIGTSLHFFTVSTLEQAVESASRKIRTGQAQTDGVTLAEFKEMITEQGTGLIKSGHLNLHIQKSSDWTDLVPVACLDGRGRLTPPTGSPSDSVQDYASGAGEVILVTACYEWDLAQPLAFLGFGNMANGSSLIRTATTFRTEPYQ
ncbi:TadE/TadG family type IV pilus assembly protein [Filomicrobium sp.]|uniref:TadE/TadG family type IV pilus assembly protein n=1 Tax=Filomicrobium sp. TaxID=2024831 RepID=UPI00258BE660|nr:TadE/TadG family type IV pilus assembly protein [Filomicrobium sp.]MCV0370309.1 pilus assembly protein [Filomicrobium sp.]